MVPFATEPAIMGLASLDKRAFFLFIKNSIFIGSLKSSNPSQNNTFIQQDQLSYEIRNIQFNYLTSKI